MTHADGQNFIKQIADAYQALEREGGLLDQIDRLKNQSVADGERIARLEIRLMERHEAIEALQAKLRSVEAERDDAGFRELEEQDKVAGLLSAIRASQATLGAAVEAVEPKPEPPVFTGTEFERTAEPIVEQKPEPAGFESAQAVGEEVAYSYPSEPQPEQPIKPEPWPRNERGQFAPGQSEASPTAQVPAQDSGSTVASYGAENTMNASQPTTIASLGEYKPYAGLLYIHVPGWISRSDWLSGGGTDATYDWREGQPMPEGVAA